MEAQENLADSFTRSTAWILAGRIVAFAITAVLPLLLVRSLDRHAFGLYREAFIVVNTAVNAFPLGFGWNAYYFLPREPSRQGAVVLNTLLLLSAMAMAGCVVFLVWPGLLVFLSKEPEIVTYAPLISAYVGLWILAVFLEIDRKSVV